MRKLFGRTGAAGVALLCLLLSGTEAGAEYQFDDLSGPSGSGEQWMVLTGSAGSDTAGSPTRKAPLMASGDIVSDRNRVYLTNGSPEGSIEGRDIHTMYLVLMGTQAQMSVNFTAAWNDEPVTEDVRVSNSHYETNKTSEESPYGFGKLYDFKFSKINGQTEYGTVKGYFKFLQNPSERPSQSLLSPFIIANVVDGTAEDNPLLLRTTLRNSDTTGSTVSTGDDITAYDRFDWRVTDNKLQKGQHWVFVPVDTWPLSQLPNRRNYHLTTEVTNYTGYRYAVQRYDGINYRYKTPRYWAFDLPQQQLEDVPKSFQLHSLSHIAPGLRAVYMGGLNVTLNTSVAWHNALRLYIADDPANHDDDVEVAYEDETLVSQGNAGYKNLDLTYRLIFGERRGTAQGRVLSSPNNLTKTSASAHNITAFRLRTTSDVSSYPFLEKVALAMSAEMGSAKRLEVKEPETNVLSNNSVGSGSLNAPAVRAAAVNVRIPGNLLSTETEGLLPLHVTLNIHRTEAGQDNWNVLAQEWHQNGDIRSLFRQKFDLKLLSEETNDCSLEQELKKLETKQGKTGYYDQLVKVFLDEEREVITVSFIAMLMDGKTRNDRPLLNTVEEAGNRFLVIRDGNKDDIWNLTFFITPASASQTPSTPTETEKGGGGGGCGTLGLGAAALLSAAAVLKLKRKGR